MKRGLKWIALIFVCLIGAFLSLFIGTRGDYPVARLVTDDPTLPSETIAGVQLHMRVHGGPADAPVIIVLHGGPGGDFRSLGALARLSDNFTIVFYDQRGAGLSERVPAEMLTLDGYLAELSAIAETVSPDAPPILIGHSWGAMLATAYLGRNPGGAKAAVLIEPGYLDEAGFAAWQAESQRYLAGPAYWREALVTGFRAQHVEGSDAAAQNDFLIGHMVGVFTNHPDNPYHCGDGYTAPSWRFGSLSSDTWGVAQMADFERFTSGASAFAGPVLLMAGECNSWTGPALQERHQVFFHNADLSVIAEAGHDVIWDNPEASLSTMRAFLTAGTEE
ncbi:alpha/beta fold hydrolase [Gymnodinialimonas sp.]